MKSLITAIVATLMLATQANALSCMQPDPLQAYARAVEAEEAYLVVLGKLSFDASKLPKAVGNNSPKVTHIPARIDGKALTDKGFDYPLARDVTLEMQCFGPWCARAVDGAEYLAFLRKEGTGYTISIDPCGSMNFPEPTPEMIQSLTRCHSKGQCG